MTSHPKALLRLRGLPFTATVDDIRAFFDGYTLAGVHMCQRGGKPNGEAYVQFETEDEARQAREALHHAHMGSRYVEIFEAQEADLVARVTAGGPPSLAGAVVRLRGLPFASTAEDVLAFLGEGCEVLGGEEGVVFSCAPDGRPSGEAFVELARGEEDVRAALERHKQQLGSRYVEVFGASKGDLYTAVQQSGFFTCAGGRRRHHWHPAHGSGGGRVRQAAGGDDLAGEFAGFGLSHRDMQVPGPRRGGSNAPPDAPPHRSRQGGSAHAGVAPGIPGQPFNPAPGPPQGKAGGRGGVGGARQGMGAVGGYPDWGMHRQVLFAHNPYLMQHAAYIHMQQPGAWPPHGIPPQQQGAAWYGSPGGGRGGMQMAVGAHYPGQHYVPQAQFYPQPGMPGMHQVQHHGGHAHAQQPHAHARLQPQMARPVFVQPPPGSPLPLKPAAPPPAGSPGESSASSSASPAAVPAGGADGLAAAATTGVEA